MSVRLQPNLLYLFLLICVTLVAVRRLDADRYAASSSNGRVKVFILAGQSNMEGKGFPEPLVWQVGRPEYRERYRHLIQDEDFEAFTKKVAQTRDPQNRRKQPTYLWSSRHDVWINYLGKRGDLTVGYGTPANGFGPELNFGHVVGDHFAEQVLLIKTAWGGRALAKEFLPPSSMPSEEEFEKLTAELNEINRQWNEAEPARVAAANQRIEAANATADKPRPLRKFKPRPMVTVEEFKQPYGRDYRLMVDEVTTCLAELGERFPGYRGQGYELAGFVWFQGWNDQYQDRWLSYEKNLANLIRDIRRDLEAPGLPVVIGQMGHDGLQPAKPGSPRDYIKKAQAAVPLQEEFRDSVVCVKTGQYWDLDAHAIYTGPGGWSKDVDRWRQFGNDRPYHYYGSPWTFAQIGTGFGEAMLGLLGEGN